MPARVNSALSLNHLDAMMRHAELMPPAVAAVEMRKREYNYLAPGMEAAIRVATDAAYFTEHADNVELWSPGSPIFPDSVDLALLADPPTREAFIKALNKY